MSKQLNRKAEHWYSPYKCNVSTQDLNCLCCLMAYGFIACFPIAADSCASLSCPCSKSARLSINASRSTCPSQTPVGSTEIGRSPKIDSPCPLFCRLVSGAMVANNGKYNYYWKFVINSKSEFQFILCIYNNKKRDVVSCFKNGSHDLQKTHMISTSFYSTTHTCMALGLTRINHPLFKNDCSLLY